MEQDRGAHPDGPSPVPTPGAARSSPHLRDPMTDGPLDVALAPAHPRFAAAAALFDDYRVHYRQPSDLGSTGAWLAEHVTAGRLSLLAALEGDDVVGFVTTAVLPASLRLGTVWSVRDLYVMPSHRGRGTARRLLRHVVAAAEDAGVARLSLQTESDNTAALGLYRSLGFRPVDGLVLLNLTTSPPPTS